MLGTQATTQSSNIPFAQTPRFEPRGKLHAPSNVASSDPISSQPHPGPVRPSAPRRVCWSALKRRHCACAGGCGRQPQLPAARRCAASARLRRRGA
eukprot:74866-Chlamydomonas_euryale.AAC.1